MVDTPKLARRAPLGVATLTVLLWLAWVGPVGADEPVGASAYIGCFKDTGDRDLNGHLEFTQTNSPETCIATCLDRGFAYAGVQWGQACLCGDSYGKYGPATNCDMTCTGDPQETCGGFAANEVWETGKGEAGSQPSEPTGTACSQIAIPSYFYPGALWDQAISGAPKVGILIVNPDSGPGGAVDPEYATAVTKAKAAGVRVIGYVYTSYGGRGAAEVEADIEKYKSWYQVDGIFLDEVSDQAGLVPYYQDVADHIRSAQGSLVMLNPGVYPDEGYMNVGDIVVVFEDAYSVYLNATVPSWASNYPASKFSHLVYGAPDGAALDQAMSLAGQRNAGYIYVTSDNLPNPWDELPSYWSSELALACSSPTSPGGGPTAPTPLEPTAPAADTQPPVVTITSPSSGTRVAPSSTVQINASASDDVGVTKVDFYRGSQLICSDTSAPYDCAWTVPPIGRGSAFSIQAKAYDAAGNVGQSPFVGLVSFVFTDRR
jgi:hypothetical protein